MPKWHPECKPRGLQRVTGTGERSKTRNDRAAKEADECVAMYKSMMVKLAMGLAMVDRYDGFVVMAALPEACNNLKGVLIAHDKFRHDWLMMKTGGSIVGLIFAHLMMVVPIAAHHGLVPQQHIAAMLTNLPVTLYKVQQRMRQGEEALTEMMADFASGNMPTQQRSNNNANLSEQ